MRPRAGILAGEEGAGGGGLVGDGGAGVSGWNKVAGVLRGEGMNLERGG